MFLGSGPADSKLMRGSLMNIIAVEADQPHQLGNKAFLNYPLYRRNAADNEGMGL